MIIDYIPRPVLMPYLHAVAYGVLLGIIINQF